LDLERLGWTPSLDEAFEPYAADHVAGRIAVEHRGAFVAYTQDGELWAHTAGRLRHIADDRSELPAVGDWAALRVSAGEAKGTIAAVLPRKSAFIRKEAGFETGGQVLAANIDLVWIVGALTKGLSARRFERYLAVAWESGAQPVIVLTKADLGDADPERIGEVERVAVGSEVIVTSAVTGEGIDVLEAQLAGKTAALLGVSGVGKSTLINRLLGTEHLATLPTDNADVGRHTTTHRELVVVPSGGLVIDTPGLRELVPWEAETGLDVVFSDIDELSTQCRFDDCAHRTEPGCAIRAALASGDLEITRLRTYEKMQRELAYIEGRKTVAYKQKRKSKEITKMARQRRRLGIDR
jgi:ribosome biogenesis GTPase / thiamine phosphate phosphatase